MKLREALADTMPRSAQSRSVRCAGCGRTVWLDEMTLEGIRTFGGHWHASCVDCSQLVSEDDKAAVRLTQRVGTN